MSSAYFGTEAIEWGVPGEHDRLTITAEADVTTDAPGEPSAGGWEAIRAPRYTDAGGEFLLIGHGRFYGDVPPIKGVYKGAAQAEHEVNVTMTRR